jgi:hypothetical protein
MVLSHVVMAEPLRITLTYRGKGVDDGTMPIDEVAEALMGFSGAYGKVATRVDRSVTHQLRVGAVETGSFDLLIYAAAALATVTPYAVQVEAAEKVINAGKHIFSLVAGIVRAKKHIKRQPYEIAVKGDNNNVFVINAEGAQLAIPTEIVELLRSGLIDADLKKIVEPLETERVDAVQLTAGVGKEQVSESVDSSERGYFELDPSQVTTKETEVVGQFISLNKERNKGTVKLRNNVRVPYHYIGEDKEQFHSDFSRDEPMRITGIAEFSAEDLSVVRLNIKSVRPIQGTLPLPLPDESESDNT